MIDWSYVGWSALSILGLSVELSVISIAIYRSSERKLKLREILWEKGFRTCLDLGMVLFSLGLFGLAWSGENRFAEAVRRAAGFIFRWRYADGSFPQVVYPSGRVNRHLRWVAAVGDMLRTLELTRNLGVEFNAGPSLRWPAAARMALSAPLWVSAGPLPTEDRMTRVTDCRWSAGTIKPSAT